MNAAMYKTLTAAGLYLESTQSVKVTFQNPALSEIKNQ